MTARRPAARARTLAALTGAVLLLVGCTTDGAEDDDRVDAGQVEEVPATSVDVDSRAVVPLPSGVLSLGLASSLDSVETDEATLTPGADVDLVGVTWSFTPHPSSEARSVLLAGTEPESLPQPSVSVTGSSGSWELPVVAQAGRQGGVVVGAEDPQAVVVSYDGLEQTVDLGSGEADAGQADALADLVSATTSLRRPCPAEDFPPLEALDSGCRVEALHLLPWVAGLGWAPESQDWLVVDARIDGEATLRLDDDPGQPVEGAPESVTRVAFAVAQGAPRVAGFDFGPPTGVVSVPLD